MAHLFIFGLGYSAKRIKRSLERIGWTVEATGSEGDIAFADELAVRAALGRASYLSSTGVYGDTGGAWVDESAPTGSGRRSARAQWDAAWLARGARVFRLPGIYGPGRSAV